jgi:hypothetical protein
MKIAVLALLVVHGVIHLMGVAGSWQLARFEGATPVPTNLVELRPGSAGAKFLGVVWLVALFGFLLAAWMLWRGSGAWRLTAVAATIPSLAVVALWWKNAPLGGVANALVLLAVLAAPALDALPD